MIACYCRVSTEEQNLERQLQSTHEYAQSELNYELAEIETYRDKSTGTSTERKEYKRLMSGVKSGQVDAVVVHEISQMARSLRNRDRTISRVTDSGSEIHFVRDGLSFGDRKEQPTHGLQMQMLGAFAE